MSYPYDQGYYAPPQGGPYAPQSQHPPHGHAPQHAPYGGPQGMYQPHHHHHHHHHHQQAPPQQMQSSAYPYDHYGDQYGQPPPQPPPTMGRTYDPYAQAEPEKPPPPRDMLHPMTGEHIHLGHQHGRAPPQPQPLPHHAPSAHSAAQQRGPTQPPQQTSPPVKDCGCKKLKKALGAGEAHLCIEACADFLGCDKSCGTPGAHSKRKERARAAAAAAAAAAEKQKREEPPQLQASQPPPQPPTQQPQHLPQPQHHQSHYPSQSPHQPYQYPVHPHQQQQHHHHHHHQQHQYGAPPQSQQMHHQRHQQTHHPHQRPHPMQQPQYPSQQGPYTQGPYPPQVGGRYPQGPYDRQPPPHQGPPQHMGGPGVPPPPHGDEAASRAEDRAAPTAARGVSASPAVSTHGPPTPNTLNPNASEYSPPRAPPSGGGGVTITRHSGGSSAMVITSPPARSKHYTFDQCVGALRDVSDNLAAHQAEVKPLVAFMQKHGKRFTPQGPDAVSKAARPPQPPPSVGGYTGWRAEARERPPPPPPNAIKDHVRSASDKDKIRNSVRSALNKLTPEKFDALLIRVCELVDEVCEINERDENFGYTEKDIVNDVYKVAVTTKIYSPVFAQLCYGISAHQAKRLGVKITQTNFRRSVIQKCQEEFKDLVDASSERAANKDKPKTPEEEEADVAARKRAVANIHFVGELFKLSLVNERAMHQALEQFVSQREEGIDEEQLETMCQLLTTVGKELDTEKAKSHMDSYMQRMLEFASKTSTRMKFLIQNVVDLRNRHWKPRIEETAPQALTEVERQRQPQQHTSWAQPNMSYTGAGRGTYGSSAPLTAGGGSSGGYGHSPPPVQAQSGWVKSNRAPASSTPPPAPPRTYQVAVTDLNEGQDDGDSLAREVNAMDKRKAFRFVVDVIKRASEHVRYAKARQEVGVMLGLLNSDQLSPTSVLPAAAEELFISQSDFPKLWDCFGEVLKAARANKNFGADVGFNVFAAATCNALPEDEYWEMPEQVYKLLSELCILKLRCGAAMQVAMIDPARFRRHLADAINFLGSNPVEPSLTAAAILAIPDAGNFERMKAECPRDKWDLSAIMSAILAHQWSLHHNSTQSWASRESDETKTLIKKLLLFYAERGNNANQAVVEMRNFLRLMQKARARTPQDPAAMCNSILGFLKSQKDIGIDPSATVTAGLMIEAPSHQAIRSNE